MNANLAFYLSKIGALRTLEQRGILESISASANIGKTGTYYHESTSSSDMSHVIHCLELFGYNAHLVKPDAYLILGDEESIAIAKEIKEWSIAISWELEEINNDIPF